MCSICLPILGKTSFQHEQEKCPLKKSLWCEFCASNGHTQWTCKRRILREAQVLTTSVESTHKHPEHDNWYKKPIFTMPKTEKASKALLKAYGGSYSTDFDITKKRLRKKLESLNYEVLPKEPSGTKIVKSTVE